MRDKRIVRGGEGLAVIDFTKQESGISTREILQLSSQQFVVESRYSAPNWCSASNAGKV